MDDFTLADERAFVAADPRMDCHEVVVDLASGFLSTCVVVIREGRSLSPSFREANGLAGAQGRIALLGGGLARGICAVGGNGQRTDSALEQLFASAHEVARAAGARPFGVFVPDPVVVPVAKAIGAEAQRTPMNKWSTLNVAGVGGLAQFVSSREPRKVRQTWARDLRAWESLGASAIFERATAQHAAEAAALVSQVSARNGSSEHEKLAAWRLTTMLSRPGEHHICLAVDEATGRTIGHTFVRQNCGTLDVHTVGIPDDYHSRRDLYQSLAYLLPLQLGLSLGVERIDYGIGHPDPKKLRGCDQLGLWAITPGAHKESESALDQTGDMIR